VRQGRVLQTCDGPAGRCAILNLVIVRRKGLP